MRAMPDTAPGAPGSQEATLQAEIVRLNKMVQALMNRAERNTSAQGSEFSLFQTAIELEDQVRRRTQDLEAAMRENEKVNRTLQQAKAQMELEIQERMLAEAEVFRRNAELTELNRQLSHAHEQLVQSEKLAALGGLVAGIAHEINTPIGIGVTAASFLQEQTLEFEKLYAAGQVKHSDMTTYLRAASEAGSSLVTTLQRAVGLVQSFKQVAVDQSSEQRRRFNFNQYIDEILDSLRPTLKRTGHVIDVVCPGDLELDSYPGAFSQILTNLVINSLQHGFAGMAAGRIEIIVQSANKELSLRYADNGCGMSEANAKRVFEPFFTTRRGQGGSGLGLHVVYNLVTQTLRGRIECHTAPGAGVQFLISVPIDEEPRHEQSNTA
jgi:two-component system NtrC family sensor kinase